MTPRSLWNIGRGSESSNFITALEITNHHYQKLHFIYYLVIMMFDWSREVNVFNVE